MLRSMVGLAPDQILAATEDLLCSIVAGARSAERARRLRRCAELAIAGAPWRAYPGIGRPGTDRIDLFTGTRAVLALDANGLRVLARLGFSDPARSYATSYRQAQVLASEQLPATLPACQRAYQLLRRHGQLAGGAGSPVSCSSWRPPRSGRSRMRSTRSRERPARQRFDRPGGPGMHSAP